jgi:hypothetical protein
LPAQFGVQPQTLTVPPPPHVAGATQSLGHVPPQPLEPPHRPEQLGVQPQTLTVPPPPHVAGAVQVPQLSNMPQPSAIIPQFLDCAAHVVAVHG